MVSQEIFHAHALGDGVFPQGNSLCSSKIIFGDFAGGLIDFHAVADEEHSHAVFGVLYLARTTISVRRIAGRDLFGLRAALHNFP